MKFLVLGCNGMAGHMISLYLSENGHDVLGFDRNESKLVKSVAGNAFDTGFLAGLIKETRFDAVINCIGILNRFAEENKSVAAFLNGYLPHFLADTVSGTDTQIIHMSTDCVFSGERGGYTEVDFPDGKSFYARSKALGEIGDSKNLTLRNSIVGPDHNPGGIGLLNWFMKSTVQTQEVNGYTKAIWTGQTTLQLAKTMEVAAKEKVSGLINAVPENSITKCDLLKLFSKYFRNNSVTVTPVDGIGEDKSLKRTRFDFGYKIPDYEFMVKELADFVEKHKNLYPHYNI